jgi:protein-disulfide isomerase
MIRPIRAIAGAAIIAATTLLVATPTSAQDLRGEIEGIIKEYLATHPDEVGQIAKDYLVRHPEVFQEILAAVLKKRAPGAGTPAAAATAAPAIDKSAAVKGNAAALFDSPRQVTLGNPQGDVTLVEFFDYNCGYCKRALADTLELLKSDTKLKIVLKEFPILGPGSLEAARVAVAVRMQDSGGDKYLAFHQKLLGARGPVNKDQALAAAQELGLDMPRLATDMASEEVAKTLEESTNLARSLGLNGTPGYVVGDNVVIGAVGIAALNDKINLARHKG